MGRQNKQEERKHYRLTVVDDKTHEQIRTVRFSKFRLGITLFTVVVLAMGVFYILIALTPLRSTIPGYPDAHFRKQAISNAIKIDSLENAITRWKIYSYSIAKALDGESALELDSLTKGNTAKYLSNKSAAALAAQDSALRAQIAKEEEFGVDDRNRRDLPIEGIHFFTPLKGVISQGFDMVLHPALDIMAPANSVVMSILDGTVIYDRWTDQDGYTIAIQHAGDIISIYSHNQKLLKKTGDKVTAGSSIALIGNNTSLTKGDHLHFQLWYKGEAVDPAQFINF